MGKKPKPKPKKRPSAAGAAAEWDTAAAEELTRQLETAYSQTDDPKERVRIRNIMLARQADPIGTRGAKPKVFPSAPTVEMSRQYRSGWHAETMIPGAGPVPPLNRHRPKRGIEMYERHFSEGERAIFALVYQDAEAATIHNVTVNYEGSSGGGRPWQKHGGLGNVSERVVARYLRFQWVLERLPHYPFVEALRWLVIEERSAGMNALPSVADAGRRWVPTITHEPTARGVSIGVLKSLAALLIHLYAVERSVDSNRRGQTQQGAQQ